MKRFFLAFVVACGGEEFSDGATPSPQAVGSGGAAGAAGAAGAVAAGAAGAAGGKVGGAGVAGVAGGAAGASGGSAGAQPGGQAGQAGQASGGASAGASGGAAGGAAGGEGGAAGEGGSGAGGAGAAGAGGAAAGGGQGGAAAGAGGAAGEAGAAGAGGSAGGAGGAGPPSCGKKLECGNGDDCCAVDAVPGGSFLMGRGESDAVPQCINCQHEAPEHVATVGPFGLDRYEVTIARMRAFVLDFDAFLPGLSAGQGAHPKIPGSGWQTAWTAKLPPDAGALSASLGCGPAPTWTAGPGPNEGKPATCLTWFVAAAFCLWDGGRLPTEAEWEFAAAGGDENRIFPWGASDPSAAHAEFSPGAPAKLGPGLAGVHAAGVGRFGHHDLAGNATEWVLDFYSPDFYKSGACLDCANLLDSTGYRAQRGGNFALSPYYLRAAARDLNTPTSVQPHAGVRCARVTSGG